MARLPRPASMNLLWLLAAMLVWGTAVPALAQPAPGEVRTSEDETSVTLDNGVVRIVVNRKSGDVTTIEHLDASGKAINVVAGARGLYFDINAAPAVIPEGVRPRRAGYMTLVMWLTSVEVKKDNGQFAEVVIKGGPTPLLPFRHELRYVLPRGASGFYMWARFEHGKGMPAGSIEQTRWVLRTAPDRFSHHVVNDRRIVPVSKAGIVKVISDATTLMTDGTVYCKYDNSIYYDEHYVHGMANADVGVWMITPSNEFVGGGPIKQELSVHEQGILLCMLQGKHYGTEAVRVADDEEWSKVYGPAFVYVNRPTPGQDPIASTWADAKRQATDERGKWPYGWVDHPDYPVRRGAVRGTVRLAAEGATPADVAGAWVVLVDKAEDWSRDVNGYGFWSRVRPDGTFEVPKVRPGTYTLFVSGGDQFTDYRKADVTVSADGTTDLGELVWVPESHGRRLWQIGRADRSAAEFKGGDNYRNWGNFLRYPKDFPDDVVFTVGKSKEKDDWNFAQWSFHANRPHWTIRFDVPEKMTGTATLTLGVAAATPVEVRPWLRTGPIPEERAVVAVGLNGEAVSEAGFVKSGAAIYRSGVKDSHYQVQRLTFDASRLKPGMNEITLSLQGSRPVPPVFVADDDKVFDPFGGVMYDAIRLEVK